MLEKTQNPLDLNLQQIEAIIAELQPHVDSFNADECDFLTLEESGCALEIKVKDGSVVSYNLEQCKKLKTEFENPMFQSMAEMS